MGTPDRDEHASFWRQRRRCKCGHYDDQHRRWVRAWMMPSRLIPWACREETRAGFCACPQFRPIEGAA